MDGRMTQNDIRIEHIRVGGLPEFATRVLSTAKEGQFIPISMQRAIAHAHNPYAEEDDVGLLAAIDADGEVVGYFGIMPLLLRRGDELIKMHWFTTWSVSSKVRGRGVGSRLMKEALALDKDYLIVGSVYARRVCKKFGFWERPALTYYWLDMPGMGRLNPLAWMLRLIRKSFHLLHIEKTVEITNPATGFLDRILAPLTKIFFYALLTRKYTGVLGDIYVREVSQIHADPPIREDRPEIELHRGVEAVNWMLSYPWVVESGQSATEKMDYYFSDVRPMFRFIALEIYAPGGEDYRGYVVFSISQKGSRVVLKTLDFHFVDSSHGRYVLALAIEYGKQYGADTIEVPEEVAAYLQGDLPGKLVLQQKKRIYQCHPCSKDSLLAQAWPDITLHLYDGDMAFS